MSQSLEAVFNPSSVAIIGASEDPSKFAFRRTRTLIDGSYKGKIYLVNPKRAELFSRKAYPSILDVDGPADLVVIIVAPRFITSVVADSIKMGAKGIIIMTAGLGEAQGEAGIEGKRIEQQVLDEASKTGVQVIGPNCIGIFSGSANLNLIGYHIEKGPLALIAQSGNVIDSLVRYGQLRGIGFSKAVSAGNAIGVKFHEYLEYLKDDPETKAIAFYIEGIKEGNELIKVARETVKEKPIVVLKAGRSKAGARATLSHTGALAGDDRIVDAAFKQAEIIRVSNVDELFDVVEVLYSCPLPQGNRVAILSEGGGDNAITADNAQKYGMEVPILAEATQGKIRPLLIEGMSAVNPVDYGGVAEGNPQVIEQCVRACMEDDQVDAVLVTGLLGGLAEILNACPPAAEEQTCQELVNLVSRYKKPLFVHSCFGKETTKSLDILRSSQVPVFESSERSAMCLGMLMKYASDKRKTMEMKIPQGVEPPRSITKVAQIIERAKAGGQSSLIETEAKEILKEYGIPVPEFRLARGKQEATRLAEEIGYPVAAKIVSPQIIHKSDAGGVKLNLKDEDEVGKAFDEIINSAKAYNKEAQIDGVLLSPMEKKGVEVIIGMTRDAQFGPVIMFGLGGIFVEVLKDVSFRVVPLTKGDAYEMVKQIKGYPILEGVRGEEPSDIEAIVDIIMKVSRLASEDEAISELDLNPVFIFRDGASVVDARMILSK